MIFLDAEIVFFRQMTSAARILTRLTAGWAAIPCLVDATAHSLYATMKIMNLVTQLTMDHPMTPPASGIARAPIHPFQRTGFAPAGWTC